jgi:glycosyltransferase involved in cell wall biosynthesis
VATRSGGVEEFVGHGKNGLLAGVGAVDALHGQCASLLEDPALRNRLAQSARTSVEPFERLASARATLALFEQWLAEAARGTP